MNKKRTSIGIIFILTVACGCTIPVKKLPKETLADEKAKMVKTYLQMGRDYENKKDMVNAWNQYKLALTVNPQNQVANKSVKRLGKQLRTLAENHFQAGLKFLKKGQYRNARREFLLALRVWPDHPEAVKMLSTRKRIQAKKYVEHVIRPGESLSKLAKMYYGDYLHFPIIAEYNGIPDATRVKAGQKIKIPEIKDLPFFAGRQEEEIEQVSKANLGILEEELKLKEGIVTVTEPDLGVLEEELKLKEGIATATEPDWGILEEELKLKEEIATVTEPDLGVLEEEIKQKEEIVTVTEPDLGVLEEEIKQKEEIATVTEPDWVGLEEETKQEEEKEESHEEAEVLTMYLDQGINLFNEDKYQEAIVEFNKFVNVNSDHKIALEYLYKSHFQQGMFLFAKQDYLSAKKEFESSIQYKSDCEKCHEYLKKSEDAYKDLHYIKGISYFRKEKLSDALREWEMVWAIDPEYKGVEQNINKVKTLLKKLEEIQKDMKINRLYKK